MSRVGLANNSPDTLRNLNTTLLLADHATLTAFLSGTLSPPPRKSYTHHQKDTMPLSWSITITGYAYSANSIPYHLALAVIVYYLILATAHCIYKLFKKKILLAWKTVPEVIVWGLKSPPPSLSLPGAGMRESDWMQRGRLKFGVAVSAAAVGDGDGDGSGEMGLESGLVHLLVDSCDGAGDGEGRYSDVLVGEAYL